ncbi:DNA polymerase/3'-5' exonuclease PolX [Candidatus Wolfebacteria bacterium]|nr:DNA polymerase/3'-5' exonuclease PolX [Candidatus Wolfebacteria bacterium]
MLNRELAKIFRNMAFYLEMEGVSFKPQAYEKAADVIESLSQDIENVYKSGGLKSLEELSGIGKNIAAHIEEYIKTGKIKNYSDFKKKIPVDIDELSQVEGLGPRKIKALYSELKIKNLIDLEKAAKLGKIRNLPQFGLKSEINILESLEFLKKSRGRFLLAEILPVADKIIDNLKNLKEIRRDVLEISFAGSLRRRKETIGDADILIAAANPAASRKIIGSFLKFPGIAKIWGKGETKISARMEDGFDIDIRILAQESFGAGLQYFTGSKEHNIVLRKAAIGKGLKLNEYGLFKGNKMIAGKTEKEIYQALGMDYIEPELRENSGEIEAALIGELPKLINNKDILGDLHIHSNWNGGENSIEELAKEAMGMGYQYIGISDHTKFLKIENGLDEKQLEKRNKEIDRLNSGFKIQDSGFRILRGCEANIMPDGSIDIKDSVLKKLDYAIAGIHHQMKMNENEVTERIIKAMKNKNVDIISHPTGRILKAREAYEIDFDKILEAAKKTGTILEINAYPSRLDLNDINIKKAKQMGVKMIINSDAHEKSQMRFIEYGVFQARRGWAEKKDIVNCWQIDKLKRFFK